MKFTGEVHRIIVRDRFQNDNLKCSDITGVVYGLRVLRAHGMSDDCIQVVCRSIVIAKLKNASPVRLLHCK